MKTVNVNNKPKISATVLNLFLSMRMLVLPFYSEMSSDVMSRIMAVTASQRLMSHKDGGELRFYTLLRFLRRYVSKPERRSAKPIRK